MASTFLWMSVVRLKTKSFQFTLVFKTEIVDTNTCACRLTVCGQSGVQLFKTLWTAAHQAPRARDFPSKNSGLGCHFLLRGTFPTQGWSTGLLRLLHWQVIRYHLRHLGQQVHFRGWKVCSSFWATSLNITWEWVNLVSRYYVQIMQSTNYRICS